MAILTASAAALCLAAGPGSPAAGPQDADAQTAAFRSQRQAQAQPSFEKQRQEAEQQARGTIDAEAAAAIQETRKAVEAVATGRRDEALAAIERATGKVNILVGRNPAAALIPLDAKVEVIETAPLDIRSIREIGKAAEDAVEDRDFPAARLLLGALISEIRVRTTNLPLATYPAVLQEAARLIDQNRNSEATALLTRALNTLVIVERVIPLPIALAQESINQAHAMRDKDKNTALQFLALARTELERARELGYAGKDPEYAALNKAVSDVERQLRANEDAASALDKLKERVGSFFQRISGAAKRVMGKA
jgi:hypothetical protein